MARELLVSHRRETDLLAGVRARDCDGSVGSRVHVGFANCVHGQDADNDNEKRNERAKDDASFVGTTLQHIATTITPITSINSRSS
jgi:hypothetical protein